MKKKNILLTLAIFFGLSMTSFAQTNPPQEIPPLQTVPSLDLERYQGTWYQIAYLPNRFQKNCENDVTATYTLNSDAKGDKTVIVENQCFKENGTRKSIKGYAYSVDAATNAKLKVKFFWFAPPGDYWVMDVGANYEYAIVGTPNRKFLWILSRSPRILATQYQELLKKIEAQAYDVSQIKVTSFLLEQPTN